MTATLTDPVSAPVVSSFDSLGLIDPLRRAVLGAGYHTPTPIQSKAIPFLLAGRDVLGCAQTGTGKTAGFTLPMIDIMAAGRAKARMAGASGGCSVKWAISLAWSATCW